MQSLWSRAGQAHRCGCRACETVVSTLGRRVTTAARPRKVTFAEIFTACYSSMFATAAVVDAVRKEDRRQELDRQLKETQRELTDLQLLRTLETNRVMADIDPTQDEETTRKMGQRDEMWQTLENIYRDSVRLGINPPRAIGMTPRQIEHLWQSLKDIYANRLYMKEIHKPANIRVSEFLDRLQADHYECLPEATMKDFRQTNYQRLENAIICEETDQSIPHRPPLKPQHLRNDQRTVAHLVKQLLQRAGAHDKSKSPSPSFDEALQLVNNWPSFTFESIDPERMIKNRVDLNRRLREVVDSDLNLKEKVGRVCHNLLVSAYPADMHTYNTLIVAFDKHGYKYLSESLVNSFFYYRLLMPTPSTFVAILNHYKNSQNHGRFLRAIACITGLDADTGAKVGRRHVDDDALVRDRRYKTRTACTLTGDWVWQHAPLNKSLVEAIFDGLLHFKLFEQAASFFVSCIEVRVVLSSRVIREVLDECILALDWKAAVRLVKGFTENPRTWAAMFLNLSNDVTSFLIKRVYVLLDLAGLQGSDEQLSESVLENLSISSDGFQQFLNVLARIDRTSQLELQGSNTETRSLTVDHINSAKSRLLQIEAFWREHTFVRKMTRSIESKLLYPDFSPQFRRSMALHIGNTAMKQTIDLNGEIMDVLTQLPLSKQVEESVEKCQSFHEAASAMRESSVGEEFEETRQGVPEEQDEREAQAWFQKEQSETVKLSAPDVVATERIGQESGRLRARPIRLIAWPVPDEQAPYQEQGRWARFS
ncbi:hypothetical protein F66182_5580 [Fusarium sp. NRRL 66182]|nr:hypothetical protein F66182_5580 [Fusarium sp. NRRL 66182]